MNAIAPSAARSLPLRPPRMAASIRSRFSLWLSAREAPVPETVRQGAGAWLGWDAWVSCPEAAQRLDPLPPADEGEPDEEDLVV